MGNKPGGAACYRNDWCQSNICYLAKYKCVGNGRANEVCYSNDHCHSNDCYFAQNKCVGNGNVGEACWLNDHCHSNVCYFAQNKCVGNGNTGEACWLNDHCNSNDCDDNRCAAAGKPCDQTNSGLYGKSGESVWFCNPKTLAWEEAVTQSGGMYSFGSYCVQEELDNNRCYGAGNCENYQCNAALGAECTLNGDRWSMYHVQMKQEIKFECRVESIHEIHVEMKIHGMQETGEYCNHHNYCRSGKCTGKKCE